MPTALRVALVNMPFGSARRPSIQLGLLQAILARRGIHAASHYLNLRFGARLGWERYETIAMAHTADTARYHSLGEWIFSCAAFGDRVPHSDAYLAAFRDDLSAICAELGRPPAFLRELREQEAPAFVESCLETVPWGEYDVVGFTSTFDQNCAALALARRLKREYPRLITVFGGANFEDEMGLEYVRALPWIDYAVIGEGDETFPALLERLAAGDVVGDLPGVASRDGGAVCFRGRAPLVRDLDALPEPDYDDYFAAATALGVPDAVRGEVELLYESARGCWWGAKHHCTFCGLNGLGMAYRSKSPARVLAGIDELARRYNARRFEAVDNILDQRYIGQVFGPLAEQGKGYRFFYEVKANLTREQIHSLAEGGVRHIQPGIESLSPHVLKLMDKGVRAIQNVRLLKWAGYYGIRTDWNVLVGFPGERPEDYERQLATMRLIPHLQPPNCVFRVWLERFSPYFVRAAEYGIRNVRPERVYAYLYPDDLDRERIAYFFEHDAPDPVPPEAEAALRGHVRGWRDAWKQARPPYLGYLCDAGRLTIRDARQPDAPAVHRFDGPAALIYEFCGPTYHGATEVRAHLREAHGLDADAAAVQRELDAFVAAGLMLEEDGHYLSLGLPVRPEMRKLFAAITAIGLGT
jgi:ribosomal peptide maturation radical SAM protein 1